ncbi:MAG: NAD(P)H-binding protein [Novosphingobium sp.]
MSEPVRVALVGATGLIGAALIRAAVGRDDVRIVAIARREVPIPAGAKMEVLVADPENWGDAIAAAAPQVLVSALGTTWRKAGKDEAAFRAVDEVLVLACAKAAKTAGARQMIAVSSVGAALSAKNRYLRVKGEVEQALGKVGLARLDLLRPGLLRGPRAETRPAERMAMLASPLIDLLLHGEMSKYRSIPAHTVARAILALAHDKPRGKFVHEHDAIVRAARRAGE